MKRIFAEMFEDLLIVLYWPLAFLAAAWLLQFVVWCGRVYRTEHRQAYIVWSLRNNAITNRLFRRWLYYQCPTCGGLFTGLVESDSGLMCSHCGITEERRNQILTIIDKAQTAMRETRTEMRETRTEMREKDEAVDGWTVLDVVLFFLFVGVLTFVLPGLCGIFIGS